MFKVNTDKDFFERFHILQSKIRSLSSMFQNENIEITAMEFAEWNWFSKQAKKELDNLIIEGIKRINVNKE